MCSFGHAVTHALLDLSDRNHAFLPKSEGSRYLVSFPTLARLISSSIVVKLACDTLTFFVFASTAVHRPIEPSPAPPTEPRLLPGLYSVVLASRDESGRDRHECI